MMNFEQFKRVFIDCPKNLSSLTTMPKNKEDYAKKLYLVYKYGRKDKEEEILRRVENLIIDGKREV